MKRDELDLELRAVGDAPETATDAVDYNSAVRADLEEDPPLSFKHADEDRASFFFICLMFRSFLRCR
jgi:hypothetical protein